MDEIWKDIPDFKGLYRVSSFGRILSTGKGSNINFRNQYLDKGNRFKKLSRDRDGYLRVSLYLHTKCFNYLVHRLVMRAFANESNLEGVK